MLSGNIAATLLKILWKNLYSVKCYAKSNLNVFVFTLSQWEIFSVAQFIFTSFYCSKGLKCHQKKVADDAFKFCCSFMKLNKTRYFMLIICCQIFFVQNENELNKTCHLL